MSVSMAPGLLLPDIPEIRLNVPTSSLAEEAMRFAKEHCDESIYNHAARSAYWALIIAKKIPHIARRSADIEMVVIICILHDMGLTSRKPNVLFGLSQDKRFEVDGANIAREFVLSHASAGRKWDEARLDRLWTAIALHTTPSIALHAAPEVALANMAITADFAGPNWSPDEHKGPITLVEYHAVTRAFPRGKFNREGLTRIMCGLCRNKPETTYDNFVGLFGRSLGYNGEGLGQRKYAQQWEENQMTDVLLRGLDLLDELDAPS